jgi:hypothetical protein
MPASARLGLGSCGLVLQCMAILPQPASHSPPPTTTHTHTHSACSNISSSGLLLPASSPGGTLEPLPDPRRLEGEVVRFHRVYLSSPDGVMLVREMSFDVQPGRR